MHISVSRFFVSIRNHVIADNMRNLIEIDCSCHDHKKNAFYTLCKYSLLISPTEHNITMLSVCQQGQGMPIAFQACIVIWRFSFTVDQLKYHI